MSTYRSILANLVFLLQGILIILLLFKDHLAVPVWLQGSGRFHPLLLHFPIVLILLLPVFAFFRKSFGDHNAMDNVFGFILLHAAFFVTISALTGLFLSIAGGYDPELLKTHLITGSVTAILCFLIWLGYTYQWFNAKLINGLVLLECAFMIAGSHYGGSLTHGEDFLTGGEVEEVVVKKQRVYSDSSAVFEAAVVPILEAKCFSCHNEKKAKGNLVMTDVDRMLKGGKDGPLWVAGNPLNSHIMQRVMMDPSEKKHMPPKGKPQLTDLEINLIETWISYGADTRKTFREYAIDDSLRKMAAGFIQTENEIITDTTTYSFAAADEKILAQLVSPFRTISPRAKNSPALNVSFFVRAYYKPEMLTALRTIKTQIVGLNLSNMPVKDDVLKEIATFNNLEHLILNGTDITGSGFSDLKSCEKLTSISLANTKVDLKYLEKLKEISSLKEVFLWNTPVDSNAVKDLNKRFPLVKWNRGYVPDTAEKLRLTAPQLKNPDTLVVAKGRDVILKHSLPGTIIRFTTDGKDPDSITGVIYKDPIRIDSPMTIKAIAVLPGWYSSPVSEYQLFVSGKSPVDVRLTHAPDPRYALEGGNNLIDNEKGDIRNNLMNWLGFRDRPFGAVVTFKEATQLSKITLSLADNTGGYLFPPEKIVIKGGNDSAHLVQIGQLIPEQPTKYGPARIKPYAVNIKPGSYKYIQIDALNVQKLPQWHGGKGQKGWIFIDELFFE
ncbi:c-type cytochrome domain-containing protein [Pollutibacter soli]|uniref:c-type cytochrome domain-containing protein n=1 Tax=Pollutibacter soli TaxID=3034157 RepID=UPI0030134D4B